MAEMNGDAVHAVLVQVKKTLGKEAAKTLLSYVGALGKKAEETYIEGQRRALCDLLERLGMDASVLWRDPTATPQRLSDEAWAHVREMEEQAGARWHTARHQPCLQQNCTYEGSHMLDEPKREDGEPSMVYRGRLMYWHWDPDGVPYEDLDASTRSRWTSLASGMDDIVKRTSKDEGKGGFTRHEGGAGVVGPAEFNTAQ